MGRMKDRMLSGDLYVAEDAELAADHARAQGLLDRYNATGHAEDGERDRLLRALLGGVGEGVVVKPTFRCDYGTPITIGAGTFVNYDCVMLDVVPIVIGERCQIATRCRSSPRRIRSTPSLGGAAGSTGARSRSATTCGSAAA
jgi:maltose O-acetyltransferase